MILEFLLELLPMLLLHAQMMANLLRDVCFLCKVGCIMSSKYFDVPYGAVPIVDTIVLIG